MKLTLPYPPSCNAVWRNVYGRTLLSSKARVYRNRVDSYCHVRRVTPLEGDVMVSIIAYRPRRVGDLDGVLKLTLDSLQGWAFKNDKQVVRIVAERRDDKANPRVEVEVIADAR